MVHAVQNLVVSAQVQGENDVQLLTTHMPFQAAIRVAMPIMKPIADRTLQPRPASLRVMIIAAMIPPTMPPMPRPRANIIRGRFPLQMVQRMKLG